MHSYPCRRLSIPAPIRTHSRPTSSSSLPILFSSTFIQLDYLQHPKMDLIATFLSLQKITIPTATRLLQSRSARLWSILSSMRCMVCHVPITRLHSKNWKKLLPHFKYTASQFRHSHLPVHLYLMLFLLMHLPDLSISTLWQRIMDSMSWPCPLPLTCCHSLYQA